jgi:hypothetical protein
MKLKVPEAELKAAKLPHDIFLINMIGNHILVFIVTVGMFAHYPQPIIAVPVISLAIIGYTYWRGLRSRNNDPWYVHCHWQIALRRTNVFAIAAGIVGSLVLAGYLGYEALGLPDVMVKALGGAAILPIMVTILILIVLESESLYRSDRGELPQWIVDRHPNPGYEELEEELPPAIAAERAGKVA